MSNRLREALAVLTVKLRDHASETAVYKRGVYSVSLQVTFGQKLLRISDGAGGFRLQWTDMDFLIPAADLILNGAASTPLRRDTIEITVGSNTEVFEVAPFGDDPPWRWSDPHQSMIRAHCKHIDTRALIP